jgi:hypothetical protein
VTDAGLLLGVSEAEFDTTLLDTIDEGNIVDAESAILETFLPLISGEGQ